MHSGLQSISFLQTWPENLCFSFDHFKTKFSIPDAHEICTQLSDLDTRLRNLTGK